MSTILGGRSYIHSDRPLSLDDCVALARSAMSASGIDYDQLACLGSRLVCPVCNSERTHVTIFPHKGTIEVVCANCGGMACQYWLARCAGDPAVPVHPSHPQALIGLVGSLCAAGAPDAATITAEEKRIMHDKLGREVQVGDRVALLATIQSTVLGTEGRNAMLRPEDNAPPYDNPTTELSVNARQVLKLDGPLPQEILGRKFRDHVTGLVGEATEVRISASRPPRVVLEGRNLLASPFEQCFDLRRLEFVESEKSPSAPKTNAESVPAPAPPPAPSPN